MDNKKEKIGKFLYRFSSYLFLAAAVFFVWSRNRFYDFGVYSPTVKPSDVFLFLSLVFFLLSIVLSGELRSDKEKNALLIGSIRVFCLFLFFLGLGLGARFLTLKLPFTHEDLAELGRIFLGFTGFFLTIAFAFHDERFAKLTFWSFLANIALIPFLFFPILSMLKLLLVVSPVSYTFLGFQNSTIILGFSVMITLAFAFSIYKFTSKPWLRVLFFVICCFLAAILFWTGSRAGWLAALAALGVIVLVKKEGIKNMILGVTEIVLMFLIGFAILSPLARNTAIIRIFPHLDISTTVDRYVFLQLPTREFMRNSDRIFDVGFDADRGEAWKTYALHFLENPLGVGPSYAGVFGTKNSYSQGVNAHDLWLQIAVSGGIGALVLMILVFIFAGREAWLAARRRADAVSVGLLGAFCGVLVEVTLIDSLDLRWLWVFMGLVIAWSYNTKNKPST